MKVNGKHYRTIWMEGSDIRMIDQTKIPHSFEIMNIKSLEEIRRTIIDMNIRGAGAIGAAGGYGFVQAAMQADKEKFHESIEKAAEELKNTRPTAQNLFAIVDDLLRIGKSESDPEKALQAIIVQGERYADLDAEACKKIGEFGADLIKDGANVSTHCNAGWLAFVDWGSALSPVYYAVREQNKNVFVYVDETRPRCQGARLTAWELKQENIPHTIIVDNVTGALMRQGKINIVIVGADRIAANGDVANKIGTYSSAVCAKENNIPFYVAAPSLTIDPNSPTGDSIPIEERDENETLTMFGRDEQGNISRVKMAPEGCSALNISFDVTPAKYISGIITERGIVAANKNAIADMLKKG